MTARRYPQLAASDLERVVAEARGALAGAVLRAVRLLGRERLALAFDRPCAGEATLVISLDPDLPCFHVEPRPAPPGARAGPEGGGPPPFAAMLRARAEGARLAAVAQPEGERIVRLTLEKNLSPERTTLVFELLGPSANAALLDAGETVLTTFYPVRGERRGLAAGGRYEPPPPPPGGPSPRLPLFPDLAPDPRTLAYSRALAERFAGAAAARDAALARAALEREARRRLKRADGTRRRIEAALAEADGAEDLRREAELLLANLCRIPRGAAEVTVEDWYAGGAPRRIELDPAEKPQDRAERLFRRARRLARGRAVAAERLAATIREIERLEEGLAALAAGAVDPADAARRLGIRTGPPAGEVARRGEQAKARGETRAFARRFRSRDGLEIAVGRSDADTDRLTFHEARGNDLFLHVQGFAGSHVIIRAARGKSVPLETMLDAAALAVHYSKARGRARAEVSVTPRKYVRRPRGGAAGAVVLERHETLVAIRDDERLRRVLGTGGPRDADADAAAEAEAGAN